MTKDQLIIELNKRAPIVNLGTSADAPSEDCIAAAEQGLGVRLPEEYKWFLRTFGGGEICGEEIYSIYGLPFEEAVGGTLYIEIPLPVTTPIWVRLPCRIPISVKSSFLKLTILVLYF